ncbi:reverse transcriptase domain-containing protein [Tanacetum coccineum]|uniref:Reverse transcriptase domain-containing protein n=1 Tax=Tanacetum coccineum TaxID=301880 RepID=A0ABQ5BRH4_9ASTR
MTSEAIEQLIGQRMAEALATCEANSDNENENMSESGNQNEVNGGVGGVTPVAKTVGIDEAYGMSWKDLMKLMIEVYCPRNEIQKLESELWNLCVKGKDVTRYTRRFQELLLLCPRMVPEDAIKMASNLMDQKVRAYVAMNAENKRKFENNPWDNRVQQPPFKRQDVVRAYTAGTTEKKAYVGTLPY